MSILNVRPKEECRWDAVALGEVMLRFDPGESDKLFLTFLTTANQ